MSPAFKLALGSLGIGALVFALKLLAWAATGSIALLSDAVESVVNIAAAAVALLAIQVADRPADRGHPFGHHKAEFLAAVFEGVLIVLAALFILQEAYQRSLAPQPIEAPLLGMALMALATVLNAFWARRLMRRGAAMGSPVLVADGRHLWADVITTIAVATGLVLTLLTGWWQLDPLISALMAGHILWVGWQVMQGALGGLMDEAVPPETLTRLRDTIAAHASGALEVHDLKTRHAGRAVFVEFHLIVPGDMTVETAHDICDRLEAALAEAVPGSRTVIHLEPDHKVKATGDAIQPNDQA